MFWFDFLPDFNLLTNWGAVGFGSCKIQLQPSINLLLMEANSVYGLFWHLTTCHLTLLYWYPVLLTPAIAATTFTEGDFETEILTTRTRLA